MLSVFSQRVIFILVIHSSLVVAPFPDFESAKFLDGRGLCSKLLSGGYGFGYTDYSTESAECVGLKAMKLVCKTLRPTTNVERKGEYECSNNPKQICVENLKTSRFTHDEPDAGCLTEETPDGEKLDGNYACSSTLHPHEDLYIESSVITNDPNQQRLIQECDIEEGEGESERPPVHATEPCFDGQISNLNLVKDHVYKACIFVGSETLTHIAFHWKIKINYIGNGPDRRRHEGSTRPLSELVTIDDSRGAPGSRIELV
ncbi:Calcium-binding protein [Teratosphaeria destructans]|uniref:Calcium-binding protein n=1 Tax=Teratosphaeria destructans TaxID=418781 RepID=A0A9W7SQN8_9PEZI|nr:Calcium-binding protein [Teratosphaeria destructans]